VKQCILKFKHNVGLYFGKNLHNQLTVLYYSTDCSVIAKIYFL